MADTTKTTWGRRRRWPQQGGGDRCCRNPC